MQQWEFMILTARFLPKGDPLCGVFHFIELTRTPPDEDYPQNTHLGKPLWPNIRELGNQGWSIAGVSFEHSSDMIWGVYTFFLQRPIQKGGNDEES